MKRPAQPEELSPAYVFLASPVCSSYITGIVLPVTRAASGVDLRRGRPARQRNDASKSDSENGMP